MVVVSHCRLPAVQRQGCPAPAEVLFQRRAEVASVAAERGKASNSFSATRCGGGVRKDQRIPVQSALSVLRRVSQRSGCVASGSVASEFVSVASAFVPVVSVSECHASEFAYPYRVASASQSTAYASARGEFSSSPIPLVLKALTRRAAAAKVSRMWRRLEDASSSASSRSVRVALPQSGSVPVAIQRSRSPSGMVRQSRVVEFMRAQSLSDESSRCAHFAH